MIAITIRLPYSAAIRAGVKRVENRSRPIADRHIGTQVAIHAGSVWHTAAAQDQRILQWWWGDWTGSYHRFDATDFSRLFRKVIAVATIAGCHQADDGCCLDRWGDRLYNGKPAWHIELADIVALDQPVGPVRGSLQVPWTLPDAVAAQVTAQLEEEAT